MRREIPSATRWFAHTLALLALLSTTATEAAAQLVPDADWRTIRTPRFHVHFTPDVEHIARRAAVVAESAYVALSAELHAPRGPIDLIVADNVDFSNGYATAFPTNRIVLYARPPVDVQSLRFYDDWMTILVSHELTHIFHLDRARGWWGVAQRVFGRNPGLMPNAYLPSWVKEGVAVYYETRLTGSGRLRATQNAMIARAAAAEGRLPGLGDLSLATPSPLRGEIVYAYGALAIAQVARTEGDSAIPRFIEATSRATFPFRLNAAARSAFGASLAGIWGDWRDSVRLANVAREPLADWRELTTRGWALQAPRWAADRTLLYAANTGQKVPGVYRLDLDDGEATRIGRRNALEPNVPLAAGGILYAQPEYIGTYTIRSDLWIQDSDGERRLTVGARLARPDARADGGIVAVQGLAGATRLVRVSPNGSTIAALTQASPDVHWTEPRWSPDGASIAAVRWARGGVTEIVVLDTLGTVRQVLARDRAVNASPSWTADGGSVLYSSDRDGSTQLWRAWLADAERSTTDEGHPVDVVVQQRVSDAATGLFFPELSPDDARVAAVHFRADGYHLGVAPALQPVSPLFPTPIGTLVALPAEVAGPVVTRGATAAADSNVARPYRPGRLLLPRYWTPVLRQGGGGGTAVGALTSAADVVGLHAWSAQASIEPATDFIEADLSWRYSGFGLPLVDLIAAQSWDRERIEFTDGEIGILDERTRVAYAGLAVFRPRFRTSSSLSVGAELESRRFVPRSERVNGALRDDVRGTRTTPGLRMAGRWTNVQTPALAVSAEDGLTTTLTLRQRWLDAGEGGTTRSAVGTLAGYRALSFGGYASHVLAARVAGGWQDARATSSFGAGGVDGGAIDLLPGLPIGGGGRTFGARGFSPNTQRGTMAAAGTLEWRAPLTVIGRGLGSLPVFLSRTSLAAFGDVASAWCAPGDLDAGACRTSADRPRWLASAGAELVVDAAPIYDLAYRFRFGFAVPVRRADAVGASSVSAYATVGRSF